MSTRPARCERRRPPPEFWARAEAARADGLITWGALGYLRVLVRLARARGDGRSFTLGERVIEEITGVPRINCRRWRAQLERAGLISFDRRWAYKRGWFWEARTVLVFPGASGLKKSPEAPPVSPGSKRARSSGLKKSPSLYREKEPSVKFSRRRGKPRRVEPHTAASPPMPSPPVDAIAKSTGACQGRTTPKDGESPSPAGSGGPGGTPDAKGAPAPAIPWEEQARRIRQVIERLKHVARPGPTDPPDDEPNPC